MLAQRPPPCQVPPRGMFRPENIALIQHVANIFSRRGWPQVENESLDRLQARIARMRFRFALHCSCDTRRYTLFRRLLLGVVEFYV